MLVWGNTVERKAHFLPISGHYHIPEGQKGPLSQWVHLQSTFWFGRGCLFQHCPLHVLPEQMLLAPTASAEPEQNLGPALVAHLG